MTEYLNLENHFYANYALKLLQNSGIILDSFTPSLFLKLFQHNSCIPIAEDLAETTQPEKKKEAKKETLAEAETQAEKGAQSKKVEKSKPAGTSKQKKAKNSKKK